ncbi:MAG: hypothetical protein HC892_09970 [Saprospiraceae bacterium]|nr:hypothetical protein [Saprospiraceae bacterium]
MKSPKTQTAEVLYELLTNKSITRASIMTDTGILNLTARIADLRLRAHISIDCAYVNVLNKHGRKVRYGKWSINPSDIDYAKEAYLKINK